MIANSIEARTIKPDIIQGYVLDRITRQPVMWVNIHIADSDEMALTNDNGEFKILLWKNLPVTVKVEHHNFEPITLRVTCVQERLVIMLRRISH